MKFRLILFFIFCFSLLGRPLVHAQTSTAGMSGRAIDSMNAARKAALESSAALRKYRNSKHYKDSVAHARKAKTKSLQTARQSKIDSMKAERGKITDSMSTVRKVKTDSVKEVQKKRTETFAKVKKYKSSKRFTDSVTVVRREHLDSTKRVQKAYRDSVARIRKRELDSDKAIRKHETDSIKMVRTKVLDSMKISRKKRTDSLTKAKLAKDKNFKNKDKMSDEKKKLAFEIAMKKKHEAFTNKTMLKKKWSPIRRFTQNSFTHYNYYYNANRKLEEANANMLRGGQKESYDSMIRLYPFDPDRDSTLLSGDMDSIIRKVSVGLQIHDPRVKWSNDMFLIMGQAYYYKGRYENAATTFRYILSVDEENKKNENHGHTANSKDGPSFVEDEKSRFDFLKHKSVHNDAILWLARTYVQEKQVENGQAVLSLLASDPKLPEDLLGQVAAGKAFAYIADKNPTAASEQLAIVVEDENLPDWLRMRAAFLNGQILQSLEKYADAAVNFERCLDFFPKIEMDFYARKYIAWNTLMAGKDVGDGMKPLKKVLNDGKYVSYHDQVYYVLGNLAAKAGKPDDAAKYLWLSATAPKATKKQKSLSFAALGDVEYGRGNYTEAKNAYDSAAKYAGANSKDANVIAAIQKSKGLSEVSQPAAIIHDQDSLLALAELSKKDQLSAVKHYIRDLEKKAQDSIRNAEEAGIPTIATADVPAETSDAANWYFSNPTTMQQGSNDFKRKWGTRPLTDNWRRAAGLPFTNTAGSSGGLEEDNPGADNTTTINGLPTEESLLARIPNTKEQKAAAVKSIQKAYIALAKAYLKQLDDYVLSGATLDTLDSRYPAHNQKEEELYLRYQIAIRQSKLDKAQANATELIAKFPESPYAELLKPKKEDNKLALNGGKTVEQYYEDTYNMIVDHKYTEALARVQNGIKSYDNPLFKKRFQVAEAMCYTGMGNLNMGDTLIKNFLTANPSDSLSGWAKEIGIYIADIRKNGIPSWYNDTAVAESGKPAKKRIDVPKPVVAPPPPPKPPADVPLMFTYVPTEEHYGVVILSTLDSRTGPLKRNIMSIDSSLGLTDAEVLMDMYTPNQIVLYVKKFADMDKASAFMDTLAAHEVFKDFKADEYQSAVISAKNHKKLFYDHDTQKYKIYYSTYYKKP